MTDQSSRDDLSLHLSCSIIFSRAYGRRQTTVCSVLGATVGFLIETNQRVSMEANGSEFNKEVASPVGVEPTTCGLEVRCSIQLGYGLVVRL
jgi:hypothetical protein